MKQVNKLLHQLSYLSPYKNKVSKNSGEAAGVELSSRRTKASHELQSLSLNRQQTEGSHTSAQNGSSRVLDYDQHPLEAADSQGATPTAPATADSFTDTPAVHGTNHSLQSIDDCVLQQLLNQAWLADAPSSARLVLSLCWEVANSLTQQQQQQQHVLDIVRLVVGATSWQAACTHCQDTLLLRCVPHIVGRSGLVDPSRHSG